MRLPPRFFVRRMTFLRLRDLFLILREDFLDLLNFLEPPSLSSSDVVDESGLDKLVPNALVPDEGEPNGSSPNGAAPNGPAPNGPAPNGSAC